MQEQFSSSSQNRQRRGAVGVIVEENRFLVIRRSLIVRAPGLVCFPGGSIEPGESAEDAVVRELAEELSLEVLNPQLIWQSRTAWGTHLHWFVLERHMASIPACNPAEVAEFMWVDADQLLRRNDLLGSMWDFFLAWSDRHFELPSRAGNVNPEWKNIAKQMELT